MCLSQHSAVRSGRCLCAIVLHCVHWQWTNNLPAAKLLKKAQNLRQDLKTPQNMNRRVFDNILINAVLWQSSYPLAGLWILYYPRMKIRFKIKNKETSSINTKGPLQVSLSGPASLYLPPSMSSCRFIFHQII